MSLIENEKVMLVLSTAVASYKWTPEMGARLKSLRLKKSGKMTREQLAQASSMTKQYIQYLENPPADKEISVSTEKLEALCKALSVPFGAFLPVLIGENLKILLLDT